MTPESSMMAVHFAPIGLASVLAFGFTLQSAVATDLCVDVTSLASPTVPRDPSAEHGLSTFIGDLDCGLAQGGVTCLSKRAIPLEQAVATLKKIASAAVHCAGAKRKMFYANSLTVVVVADDEPEIIVALREEDGPGAKSFRVRQFIRLTDDAAGGRTAAASKAGTAANSGTGANGASVAAPAKVSSVPCEQLKQVLVKNDNLFEALRGRAEGDNNWTANLQLGGWQDCYIALLDPTEAFFTCESGPFSGSEQIIAGIEALKIDVGACLGSDWNAVARTDRKKRTSYTFERADGDPSVEIRQLHNDSNNTWWIKLDVNSPTP